jgi:hypothetical protein
LYIAFDAAQKDSDRIRLKIYTVALRLVKVVDFTGAEAQSIFSRGNLQCAPRQLAELANGSYYYIIIAEKSGKQVRSKAQALIILK